MKSRNEEGWAWKRREKLSHSLAFIKLEGKEWTEEVTEFTSMSFKQYLKSFVANDKCFGDFLGVIIMTTNDIHPQWVS